MVLVVVLVQDMIQLDMEWVEMAAAEILLS
jgi:hypothetical protein